MGDINVLNSGIVSQLVLLNTGLTTAGGCQSSTTSGTNPIVPSPSSSPSIESRILFPALYTDNSGNTYCALYTYGVVNPGGPQYIAEIGAANPFVNVTSSPGYDGNGNVVIAAEDGTVRSYYFASNTLAWTFSNPQPGSGYSYAFDSSPTTWPGLIYDYIVDAYGDIYYLDPGTGTAKHVHYLQLRPELYSRDSGSRRVGL